MAIETGSKTTTTLKSKPPQDYTRINDGSPIAVVSWEEAQNLWAA